ncbi:MAG: hypothetical protein HOO88_04305 [Kiritimatiellaceae bacterium]|nr:hypothetical protein [Kiritimatiellaceae bacterium]
MKKLILILTTALLLAGTASADVLVSYNWFGAPGNPTPPTESYSFSTQSAGVTSNNLTRGSGLNVNGVTNRFYSTHWNNSDFTLNGAVNSNDYFAGFVSSTNGTVNLTNILFRATGNNGNVPTNWVVKVSSVNTDTAFLTAWQSPVVSAQAGPSLFPIITCDLAGNGVNSSTVYYRIYGWRSTLVENFVAMGFMSTVSGSNLADDGIPGFGNGLQEFIVLGTFASAITNPILAYVSSTVLDADGDAKAEPGETLNAFVTLNNSGTVAQGVQAVIIPTGAAASYFSRVTNSTFGTIAGAASGSNSTPFVLTVATNTPVGNYTFSVTNITVTNGPSVATSGSFTVQVYQAVFAAPASFSLAADVNQVTTNSSLVVSNSATIPLYASFTDNASWLSVSPASITIAPHSASNISLIAGPVATQGQLSGTVSATYSLPVTNGTSFAVTLDVGPRVTPLTNGMVIAEISGGILPGAYEPNETLYITIPSTNNGAITATNILHTLSANPAYFTITAVSNAANYNSMTVGSATSTTYQVVIAAGTPDGSYTFTATNTGSGSGPWTASFSLQVFNRAVPSVSSSLTITVPADGTASGSITLTNAGNQSTTFALSDNGSWPVTYSVSTQTASLVSFNLYDAPDPSTTFTNWGSNDTIAMNIGFSFPLYGTVYTNFSVSRFGNIGFGASAGANANTPPALPSTNTVIVANVTNHYVYPIVAPFWGTAVSTNSVRYMKQADKLVVSWGNRTGHEFQAWLYTNGAIRYVYEYGSWSGSAMGIQSGSNALNTAYTPSGSETESLLLTPQSRPWVTSNATNGTLSAISYQTITYTADATGQTAGTNTYNVTVTWGDGSTSVVAMTVVVELSHPSLGAPPSVTFAGPAGAITKTSMTITNTGDVALDYTITDTGAQTGGYKWRGTNYVWNTRLPLDANPAIVWTGGTDEGYSQLLPIGFSFPFYGQVYTNFSIGVNGGISLGEARPMEVHQIEYQTNTTGGITNTIAFTNTLATADRSFLFRGYSNSTTFTNPVPNNFIAPYWGDLFLATSTSVRYWGNSSQLVVTWENMNQSGGGSNLTFQAILNRDGSIRFQYQYLTGDIWPSTVIGVRNTSTFTQPASLSNDTTTALFKVYTYTVTNVYDTIVTNVIATNFVTLYRKTIGEQALYLQPSNRVVITADPTSGALPVGGTQVIEIFGDARSLSPDGSNNVPVNTTFDIYHLGLLPGTNITTNVVGGVTNITTNLVIKTTSTPVSVLFIATNSVESVFSSLDSDEDGMSDVAEVLAGTDEASADSVFGMSVVQSPDGSRTISWPKADDNLPRTYTVLYTTDLLSGWTLLYRDDNFSSYTDTDAERANLPVIYYKVTVE